MSLVQQNNKKPQIIVTKKKNQFSEGQLKTQGGPVKLHGVQSKSSQ